LLMVVIPYIFVNIIDKFRVNSIKRAVQNNY
jgi:hypothetical protein